MTTKPTKACLRKILLHLFLISLWAISFVFLFYNATEGRILNDPLPGYLGICIVLLVLFHAIFIVVQLIRSLIKKQYFMSTLYLLLAIGVVFIGRAGMFVTMIYFGMGVSVGEH